jgi:hypothetical protein
MATVVTETFYLTRDNTVDLVLKSDDVEVDLTQATKIEVEDRGCVWSVDSVASPDAFEARDDGTLILKFGDELITPGTYRCRVIIYDINNPAGIVFGEIRLVFKSGCA